MDFLEKQLARTAKKLLAEKRPEIEAAIQELLNIPLADDEARCAAMIFNDQQGTAQIARVMINTQNTIVRVIDCNSGVDFLTSLTEQMLKAQ